MENQNENEKNEKGEKPAIERIATRMVFDGRNVTFHCDHNDRKSKLVTNDGNVIHFDEYGAQHFLRSIVGYCWTRFDTRMVDVIPRLYSFVENEGIKLVGSVTRNVTVRETIPADYSKGIFDNTFTSTAREFKRTFANELSRYGIKSSSELANFETKVNSYLEMLRNQFRETELSREVIREEKDSLEREVFVLSAQVSPTQELHILVDDDFTMKMISPWLGLLSWMRSRVEVLSMLKTQVINKEELLLSSIIPSDYDISKMRITPYPHQWVMFKNHIINPTSADLSQMGTGKTLPIIMAIDYFFQTGEVQKGKVLIVVPLAIIEKWEAEIKKVIPDIKVKSLTKMTFGERGMELLIEQSADIYLINYEAFATELVTNKDGKVKGRNAGNGKGNGEEDEEEKKLGLDILIKKWGCEFVVLDEAHKIKSETAKRTGVIVNAFAMTKYRKVMSGTINANKFTDLFIPFFFLNRGKNFIYCDFDQSVSSAKNSFVTKYADRDGFNYVPKRGALETVRRLMQYNSIRFEKRECLSLPEKVYERIECELAANHQRLYNTLKTSMFTELSEFAEKGGQVSITNILTMITKLQEAANGWVYDNNGNAVEVKKIAKLDSLLEILDDIEDDEKVVIWAGRFTNDTHLLTAKLRELYGYKSVVTIHGGGFCGNCGSDTKRRIEDLEKFQTSKDTRFLVANIATVSHGIDLTSSRYMIFYGNTFSKTDRAQAEDRCHRIGMRESLTIIDIVAKNTIDELILENQNSWKSISRALLEDFGIEIKVDGKEPDSENNENDEKTEHQEQKNSECLLASLAMCVKKTIEDARKELPEILGRKEWWPFEKEDVKKVCEKWNLRFRKVTFESIDSSQGVFTIRYNSGGRHAVYYEAGFVFDPSSFKEVPIQKYLMKMNELGGTIQDVFRMKRLYEDVDDKEVIVS